PNPNHGQFTIELRATENEKYQIFITNSMGQQIIAVTKTSMQGINKWQFSYPQLQKGVYLLNVQTMNKTITQKFVVE
ncbi:MAG TPA: T9SS type A sorting domain-containing protein, partial [Chitinophagaceae bacterium]|nr:T9SS type A sorting domain-containing protein [Chitinophagaceae bacterium]